MNIAAFQPQRLRLLLVATAFNLGVWILVGVFATSEFQRRAMTMGGAVAPWHEVFLFQMSTAMLWAAFAPVAVYLAQRLPLRPPHRLRNAALILAVIPCLAVLRAATGGAAHDLADGSAVSAEMVTVSLRIRTRPNMVILAAIFFVSNLVDAKREAAKRERQRVHAQTLVARAEMEELRTRLQPQFAVRMLRHIGSVLRDEPRAADALIVTLSGILRRSMVRGSREPVRLADELEHFDRCLDLCRVGGRFSVEARYVADDDVLASRVPPVVLQPVIESVVLDLTSGDGGSVEVRCEREGDETHVEVCWTVEPSGAEMKTTLRIPTEEATA